MHQLCSEHWDNKRITVYSECPEGALTNGNASLPVRVQIPTAAEIFYFDVGSNVDSSYKLVPEIIQGGNSYQRDIYNITSRVPIWSMTMWG